MDEDADGENAEALQRERSVHSQSLFDHIELCTQLPQMLGKGRVGLVDKVGAHVHSTLLENGGQLEPLKGALKSVVAWCSDMGVESGIPQCQVSCVEKLLPSFIRPARIHILEHDEDGSIEDGGFAPQPANENFMPNAVQMPGTCHAIHNASLDLDGAP